MFLNKIRNIFCVPDTKFVSATNVARTGKRGNICVGNNVSPTMCSRLPGPLPIIDQLRKSYQRIGTKCRGIFNEFSGVVTVTEAIKDSTDKMMRSFDKPSDDTRTEQVPFVYGSKLTVAKRRFNFL